MIVVSLFDGIATARVALERAGIEVTQYYASETDKYAIDIARKNHKDIIHVGDVRQLNANIITEHVDLLIGGSPCQDLSVANRKGKGLDGEHSKLFWEYVRIKNVLQPQFFLYENVCGMKIKYKEIITEQLQVEPIMIDAALVSAQKRKRLFWTNIEVKELPKNKNIMLKDIIIDGYVKEDKAYCVTANYAKLNITNYIRKKQGQMVYTDKENLRKLYPVECERLQGLPDRYTEGISKTQRYKCLGNAFNVDVIVHILQYIKGKQND